MFLNLAWNAEFHPLHIVLWLYYTKFSPRLNRTSHGVESTARIELATTQDYSLSTDHLETEHVQMIWWQSCRFWTPIHTADGAEADGTRRSTLWVKKQDTKLLPITSRNINRFSNFFFTDGLGSEFSTNFCLNIPSRLKHVATLPCEIQMSEKRRQFEICIVINDRSQGSIAKHLRNNALVYHTFIAQSAGERIFLNW